MLCPKCNTQNQEDTQFCTSCGNPLSVSAVSSTPVPAPTPTPSFTDNILLMSIIGFVSGGGLLGVLVFYLIWSRSWERSKKIKATVIYMVILYLLVTLFVAILYNSSLGTARNNGGVQPSPQTQTQPVRKGFSQTPQPNNELAKDGIDTDNDSIPDWVETGIGLNPNKDECLPDTSQCQASFGTADNQRPKNILAILDNSGSMAEKLNDGSTKIEVAKKDLQSLLTIVPIDTNVSLMVYGSHGSNSPNDKRTSCSSIDILYPLGMANKDKIIKSLATFIPTGWTPIAASLNKAREVFAGHENENNYILLASDGEETCDGDPLSSIAMLKQSFPNLIIDVAGLNVSGNEKAQLEQIAQSGGGKFYDVRQKSDFDQILVWEHNVWQYANLLGCLEHTSLNFNDCQQKEYTKIADYLTKLALEKSNAGDEQGSRRYFDLIQQILKKQIARNDAFLNFIDGIRQSTKQYTNQ